MRKEQVKSAAGKRCSGRWKMRRQKARCHCCGAHAVIEKTAWKTDQFADVYYRCTRLECGHTWVMNLTYSHTLVPSGLENGVLKLLIERMRPEEKQMALELLQAG
ncbi:TPA: ogr/Delta-like zinc finger family protein [Escherichia coli]|nr:ogr/Delta-like zinc finger family protein [Escherichia coli]EFH9782094.1 ogr/Delta-like zinc finger family protein [Escherichia coli]MBP4013257.1 ogr/Delta-like zinc finger family protein [Escherichia coli]HAL0736832.1 ogr/Delta-like zinc finger family protein [Escherichia coli]HBV9072340.1 ogr/Delta-like zinc finger family protein [Escherichia coli]